MGQVLVYRKRTTIIGVSLGYDVSQDDFASEIRVDVDPESELLATWTVSFLNDGTDGELLLHLFSADSDVQKNSGWMDIKRITGGEPVSVSEPVEVLFTNAVTA